MQPVVAWDTETWLIEPGNITPKMVCLSAAARHPEGIKTTLALAPRGIEMLRSWLRDGFVLVGHHILFDLAVAVAYSAYITGAEDHELLRAIMRALRDGRIRDTKIREQLLDVAEGQLYKRVTPDGQYSHFEYTLEMLASQYCGVALVKGDDSWRLRYRELDGVDVALWPLEASDYPKKDAQYTLEVYEHQQRRAARLNYADGPDAVHLEKDTMRAAWALYLTSVRGMRTDPDLVAPLEYDLEKQIFEAYQELESTGLVSKKRDGTWKVNNKLVQQLVSAHHGGAPPITAKGRVKTSRETLEDTGVPSLKRLAQVGKAKTLRQTFLKTLWLGVNAPIQCSYQAVRDTLRTSCAKPNLQNLPRTGGVRECFVSRPGFYLVSCDYSALELRTLAQTCWDMFGFSSLRDAFLAGKDPHTKLAGEGILSITYEEAAAILGNPDHELFKKVKNARQDAKPTNFGLPGGMGAEKFVQLAKAQGRIFTLEYAQALKATWFATWPEMRPFFDYASEACRDGNATLRFYRDGFVRGDTPYCAFLNTHFQHPAAMMTKQAHWQATWESIMEPSSDFYGSHVVVMVHDELLGEVPREHAHEASFRLAEIMKEAAATWTPDVPGEVEPALMDHWFKDAAPVYDAQKRLAPWYPKGYKPKEKNLIADVCPEVLSEENAVGDITLEQP